MAERKKQSTEAAGHGVHSGHGSRRHPKPGDRHRRPGLQVARIPAALEVDRTPSNVGGWRRLTNNRNVELSMLLIQSMLPSVCSATDMTVKRGDRHGQT